MNNSILTSFSAPKIVVSTCENSLSIAITVQKLLKRHPCPLNSEIDNNCFSFTQIIKRGNKQLTEERYVQFEKGRFYS